MLVYSQQYLLITAMNIIINILQKFAKYKHILKFDRIEDKAHA